MTLRSEYLYGIGEVDKSLDDPRQGSLGGFVCTIGDPHKPDELFPQWEVSSILTEGNTSETFDASLVALGPDSYTPPQLIIRPPDLSKRSFPLVTEYPIEGSGFIIFQLEDDQLRFEPINCKQPKKFTYSQNTLVAYVADASGLVMVNIGLPPNVERQVIPNDGKPGHEQFWNLYKRLIREKSA